MRDALTDALNDPAGQLAGILLNKVVKEENGELPKDLRERLDKLIDAPGRPGKLARVRLAPEVPFLFDRAPNWTSMKLLPIFDWSTSPDALDAWSSRKYSRWIGSPELFGRLKKSFMEIFNRSDVPAEDKRVFGDWLAALLIANHTDKASYPLTAVEARGALRRAGPEAMASVGHRLAGEMERVKEGEKIVQWRKVVGPVFKGIWPLDVDLQTSATTFKLVQILRATGEAFPEAAETIIPFVRPEDRQGHIRQYFRCPKSQTPSMRRLQKKFSICFQPSSAMPHRAVCIRWARQSPVCSISPRDWPQPENFKSL